MRDECRVFEPSEIVIEVGNLVRELTKTFMNRMEYESADKLVAIKIGKLYPWRLQLAEMVHGSVWEGSFRSWKENYRLLVIRESAVSIWEAWDKKIGVRLNKLPQLYPSVVSGMRYWQSNSCSRNQKISWHIGGERHLNFVREKGRGWEYRGGIPIFPALDMTADDDAHYYPRWSELRVGEEFDLSSVDDISADGWKHLALHWHMLTGRYYEVKIKDNSALHVKRVSAVYRSRTTMFRTYDYGLRWGEDTVIVSDLDD